MTRRHATWYIKTPLTENVSLRYYFVFEDRKHLENSWVIKNHKDKTYAKISADAGKMISSMFKEIFDKDVEHEGVEIIGMSVSNNRYRKIEIPFDAGKILEKPEQITTVVMKNDNIIDSTTYISVTECEKACNDAIERALEIDDDDDTNRKQVNEINSFEDLMELLKAIAEEDGE